MNSHEPRWGRLVLVMVAFVACMVQVRPFIRGLRPQPGILHDFYQEWASARNRLEGLPIYSPQDESAVRYVGFDPSTSTFPIIEYNAHPPTSVLLALPLAWMNYSDAFLAWSVLSLLALVATGWLIARQLSGALTVWSILPLAALALWCNGFRQQMNQGQLNVVLLLLLTGVWAADRSDRPIWAGVLLGAAAAIKLFPGFLFVYFLARRQWRALAAGTGAVLVLAGLTVAVLGADCYRDYVTIALPSLTKYRVYWPNLSLTGFWHKLFNSAGSHVIPLWQNPALAWGATLASDAVVTMLTAWCAARSRTAGERDLAFALTLITMLLVSPITWDHYFTLLFLALFLLWIWLPHRSAARGAFWLLVIGLWLQPLFYWRLAFANLTLLNWHDRVGSPPQVLTVLSVQTYLLVGLFLFTLLVFRLRFIEGGAPHSEPPRTESPIPASAIKTSEPRTYG
jgi:hypothetical protein